MAAAILSIGAIVFAAHLFAAIFARTRIPDVLLLTLVGIALGPLSGVVRAADFGRVGEVMTTLALVVILFESGTVLDLKALARGAGRTIALSVGTYCMTMLVVALLGHLLLGLAPFPALILGAILGGTSSAVVIPMVKGLGLGNGTATMLNVESVITDVLCIVLTGALLHAALSGDLDAGRMFGQLLGAMLVAALIGFVGGLGWLLVLNAVRSFPSNMFTTIASVFILYGLAELLGLSGGIAALVFGATLANHGAIERLQPLARVELAQLHDQERRFFEELVFLLKTFFFVYLGLSIAIDDLVLLAFGMLLVVVIYTGRALISAAVLDRATPLREMRLAAIMVPKGLAAAVLAGLPVQAELEGAAIIRDVCYVVVLVSIAVTALLVPLVERGALDRVFGPLFRRADDA